ncbi:MAG: nucleotidyl transferase AbiEii/AbiGii toxin family protein [Thermodesulfobacteriota bacterium]|nr:nucleotidyl transferase AbiEii/AbiGii toxin family protein [Thermodesulfobacteriota bacterium]
MAASVRQRLLDLSRERQIDFNLMLTRYGLERFLYRLGRSEYRDRFILKGAMLFPVWGMPSYRQTRDIDLLGFGENDIETIVGTIRAVCLTDVEDDGIHFGPASVQAEDIRDQMEYGGVRVRINADLDGARIHVQVDIGFGDAVTPDTAFADFPTLLDLPAPHLRVYPRETVVAEKFQAMVQLGIANSRMKDFHDLWTIGRMFDFDGTTLTSAIAKTFERRNTFIPFDMPLALTAEFSGDAQKLRQWRAFLNRAGLRGDVSLAEAVTFIVAFVMPPVRAVALGESFNKSWPPGGPWQEVL